VLNGLKRWLRYQSNNAKIKWNRTNEMFRDVVLTFLAMILGSGKFLKDIGTKIFFMNSLFAPLLGVTTLAKWFNNALSIVFALGISYTNYLTSYSSLKFKIVSNFKRLSIHSSLEPDDRSPLLPQSERDIQQIAASQNNISINEEQPDISLSVKIKNFTYSLMLHVIALTRMFFVVCDTYLGINKLYQQVWTLFNKTISDSLLTRLTNTSGSYFAFSDGVMYCAYAYRVLLANGHKIRASLSWRSFKNAIKWRLVVAIIFASIGVVTKGIKDLFTISVSLSFVPLINLLPENRLTQLGYLGGVNSIMAKSIFEGMELGFLLYAPKQFFVDTKALINKTKLTYLKLMAFLLSSIAEAASGYLALGWIFEKSGLKDDLDEAGYLNAVQIPCALTVALSAAALDFAFNVRSLSENEQNQRTLNALDMGTNVSSRVVDYAYQAVEQEDNTLQPETRPSTAIDKISIISPNN
tara:strand:+ start:176715 stop:178115 length:1401 start_codon:yes stop_codon:yes gene_type:complete